MSKFGLALGGGGARGLAHIGVLKILDSEKIKIDAITGCSMGAIVGGLYAYYGNAMQVEEFMFEAMKHPKFLELGIDRLNEHTNKPDKNYFEQFFDYVDRRVHVLKTLSRLSYFDEEVTKEIFDLIPDVEIEDLRIKFSAVAVDLISGEEINFKEGSLRGAVRASSAIPGIFPPVKIEKHFLVDGSTSGSIPSGKVRELGADRVLAVDVTRKLESANQPKNVIEILYRTEDISSFHLSLLRLKETDLIIRPSVKEFKWTDFDQAEKLILAGELAAKENLAEIKRLNKRSYFMLRLSQYLKRLKGDQ
jgi:NTE family protein